MEHSITLPCGLVQADGSIVRDVVIHEMTGKTQKKLANPAYQSNPAKMFTMLAESCIVRVGNEPMNSSIISGLNTGDRDFISNEIWRVSREDDPLSVHITCPSCGHKDVKSFKLSDIDIIDLPPESDGFWTMVEAGGNKIYPKRRVWEARNEDRGFSVRFFFPRVGDKGQPTGPISNPVQATFDLVAGAIYEWIPDEGEKLTGPFDGTFLDSLPSRTVEWILAVFQQVAPGPDMTAEYTCPECGHASRSSLDPSTFFEPAQTAPSVGSMLTKRSGS